MNFSFILCLVNVSDCYFVKSFVLLSRLPICSNLRSMRAKIHHLSIRSLHFSGFLTLSTSLPICFQELKLIKQCILKRGNLEKRHCYLRKVDVHCSGERLWYVKEINASWNWKFILILNTTVKTSVNLQKQGIREGSWMFNITPSSFCNRDNKCCTTTKLWPLQSNPRKGRWTKKPDVQYFCW